MHSQPRLFWHSVALCGLMIIGILVSACGPMGKGATMTVIQRLPSPTVGAPQPFIVGRPYSLDAAADGGDLIMLSTTQFELIGHAQYAVVAGSSFDDITCTTIKQLSFSHPAGPIDITPNTPLGFETNDHLLAKVVFSSTNGTLAIATVIYPACP